MTTAYFLFNNSELFLLVLPFVLAFVFYLSGAIIRFISKESRLMIAHEILWVVGGLAYIGGIFNLYYRIHTVGVYVLLCLIILPSVTSAILFFHNRDRRWWYLGDLLALVLLMPFVQVATWWLYLDFLAFLYLFIHAMYSFAYAEEKMRHTFTAYSMKKALDGLAHGLAIANQDGKILYVNQAFQNFLAAYSIDAHQKEQAILLALRDRSHSLVDEESSILYLDNHYYLLRERHHGSRSELTISDVDAEISINEKLSQANESLTKEKASLLKTLDEIKALAQHQERESLRFLVHDSFAEEVSLIHQVLINPSVNDLAPLKQVVREGLNSYQQGYDNLEEMERFYGLLGVNFIHEGTLDLGPDKVSVISLIREATDNAIRHGNATEMTLVSHRAEGYYYLAITNNGLSPASATPHNGLSYLMALFEKKGGSVSLVLDPRFTLLAKIPIPKG
jgi:PAS domain-containing protein